MRRTASANGDSGCFSLRLKIDLRTRPPRRTMKVLAIGRPHPARIAEHAHAEIQALWRMYAAGLCGSESLRGAPEKLQCAGLSLESETARLGARQAQGASHGAEDQLRGSAENEVRSLCAAGAHAAVDCLDRHRLIVGAELDRDGR